MAQDAHTHMYLVRYTGGPCPACGFEGELRELHTFFHKDDPEQGRRVLVHGPSAEEATTCVISLSGVLACHRGVWFFTPDKEDEN